MNKKKRIEHLDTMRGMCLLFVNYFHSDISLAFFQYVSTICVHPFLFMAGYFFNTKTELRDTLHKKLRTMLFPYYVFGLGYYVVWVAAFARSGRDIIEPLRSVLYMPTGAFPIEPSLYFLPMMFGASMIFAVIQKCIKPEWLKLLAVVCITLVGNYWTEMFSVRLPMALDCAFGVVLYFYLGYHGRTIIGAIDDWLARLDSNILRISLYFTVTVLNYICITGNFIANMRNGVWSIVPFTHLNTCTTMLLWVYFFRWFEKPRIFAPIRWVLKYIGANSMVFMCFSHVGLYIGLFITNLLPLGQTAHNILYFIIGTLAVVPIVTLFNKTKLHYIFGK